MQDHLLIILKNHNLMVRSCKVLCVSLILCHHGHIKDINRHQETEGMRSLTLAIGSDNRRTGAEVNLCLFAGHTLHPAKRYTPVDIQAFDKSANTVVAALKSILISEVLIDSLTG